MKNPELLVISDIHGNLGSLKTVLSWGKKHHIDAAVFLGDGLDDMSHARRQTQFTAPVTVVRGNGDYDPYVPFTDTLDFAGHSFFITHGHQQRVSDGFDELITAAKFAGAGAALYGHTHIPFWEEIDGCLILNPGSIGSPRNSKGASFAVIECPPKEWFKIHYWNIKEGAMGKVIEKITI